MSTQAAPRGLWMDSTFGSSLYDANNTYLKTVSTGPHALELAAEEDGDCQLLGCE